jgi:hypothetical protein
MMIFPAGQEVPQEHQVLLVDPGDKKAGFSTCTNRSTSGGPYSVYVIAFIDASIAMWTACFE